MNYSLTVWIRISFISECNSKVFAYSNVNELIYKLIVMNKWMWFFSNAWMRKWIDKWMNGWMNEFNASQLQEQQKILSMIDVKNF